MAYFFTWLRHLRARTTITPFTDYWQLCDQEYTLPMKTEDTTYKY
jgi:hypothetical protein